MTLALRLTPFGLEQKGVYIQQDRHDEYYEQLLYPYQKNSITGDCCCVSALLLGDQNAGKSALLYAFVAAQDPRYTALTCLLPIIQAEFANRRELFSMHDAAAAAEGISPADGQVKTTSEGDVHQGRAVCRCGDEQGEKQHYSSLSSPSAPRGAETATAAAMKTKLQETVPAGTVEALLCQSRDELPFLDSDVARSAALLTAEDFAFFCNEFGIHQEQQRGLRLKVNKSRYVLLHFLEFGGDQLDRMNAFLQFRSSCSCGKNCSSDPSKCVNKCTFRSDCRECDQAAATALLLQERDCMTKETAAKAPSAPAPTLIAAGVNETVSAREAGQSRARYAAVTAAQASLLAQSLRASFLLAAEAPVVLYFINCSTMFISRSASGAPETTVSVELNASAFLTLLLRLHACCSVGSGKRLLHFVCSRLACRSVAAVTSGGELRASAVEGCSESSTGCCCSGFDQEQNFRMALESLRTFVWRLCSDNAANAAAAAVVSATAAETIEAVRRTLDQPFESLYCRFLAVAGSSDNSSNCVGQGTVARNCISWVPFEDCWGVSACARIKDEEEALQRCGSVCFLQRLLNFVWDVCMPLPVCTTFDFRDVSAVRIIERSSRQYGEREQQQCAAWGPSWQLCVASIVQLLARLLALLSEAEDHAKEDTNRTNETEMEGGKSATADALHSRLDRATTSESETSKYGVGKLAAHSWKMQKPRQQQSQQRHEGLEGESGRQLISLFSTCVQQRRQQQQRVYLPGKVCIDLWISYTDWEDFISNFDPVEQQQQQEQQQRHPKQQQQFTVSSTGEVLTTSTLEKDFLLLLPAAAAVAAFTSLAAAFVSLGCCLPCCADGGPWGPLAVQLTVCLEATEVPVTLLVLPEVLHEHFVGIQRQTQLRQQQEVRLHQKELLERSGGACLAAVRLPFHPAVARLVDNVLSCCAREPLPADFWEAGAGAAGAAAAVAGAAATAATAAQVVGHTVLTLARQRVGEALHAAAGSVQVLLLHQLQQIMHRGNDDEATFEKPLVNSLQVLLHLAGDAVLIEQITKATDPTRSYGQQSQLQQGSSSQGTSQFHAEGPFFSEQQMFWIVNLQAPAAASSAAKTENSTSGGETTVERDRYDIQTVDKRALLDPALQRLNGMLAASGLVVLSSRNEQSCSSDVPNLKP